MSVSQKVTLKLCSHFSSWKSACMHTSDLFKQPPLGRNSTEVSPIHHCQSHIMDKISTCLITNSLKNMYLIFSNQWSSFNLLQDFLPTCCNSLVATSYALSCNLHIKTLKSVILLLPLLNHHIYGLHSLIIISILHNSFHKKGSTSRF